MVGFVELARKRDVQFYETPYYRKNARNSDPLKSFAQTSSAQYARNAAQIRDMRFSKSSEFNIDIAVKAKRERMISAAYENAGRDPAQAQGIEGRLGLQLTRTGGALSAYNVPGVMRGRVARAPAAMPGAAAPAGRAGRAGRAPPRRAPDDDPVEEWDIRPDRVPNRPDGARAGAWRPILLDGEMRRPNSSRAVVVPGQPEIRLSPVLPMADWFADNRPMFLRSTAAERERLRRSENARRSDSAMIIYAPRPRATPLEVQEQRAGRVSARMMEEFPSAPMRGYLDTPEERLLASPTAYLADDSPSRKVGASTYGRGFFDTLDGRTQTFLTSARKQARKKEGVRNQAKEKVRGLVNSAFSSPDGAGAGNPFAELERTNLEVRKQAKKRVQAFVQSALALGNRGDGAGAGTPDRKKSGSKRAAPPALSPPQGKLTREYTLPTGAYVKQMNFKRDEASTFSAWKVSPEGRRAAPRGTDAKKVWAEIPRESRMRLMSLFKQNLNFDGSPVRTRSNSRAQARGTRSQTSGQAKIVYGKS